VSYGDRCWQAIKGHSRPLSGGMIEAHGALTWALFGNIEDAEKEAMPGEFVRALRQLDQFRVTIRDLACRGSRSVRLSYRGSKFASVFKGQFSIATEQDQFPYGGSRAMDLR
jgi:hypothetical protein